MSDEPDQKAVWQDAIRAAMRKQEEILAADPSRSFADPTLPVAVVSAYMNLEQDRMRFEGGDRQALLAAIRVCANHDLALPEWASRAYIRAYDEVLNCRKGSWDEAFGAPFPKGKHLAAIRKKRTKAWSVWAAVQRAQKKGRGIDDELFAEIGKSLGLGKTLVSEFYYSRKVIAERGLPLLVQTLLEPLAIPENPKILRKEKKK